MIRYSPAMHGVLTLEPSAHSCPGGHGEQSVRVVWSRTGPPLVKDPAGHVLHELDPAPEYSLSPPHAVQVELPAVLCFPAIHWVCVLLPSQA